MLNWFRKNLLYYFEIAHFDITIPKLNIGKFLTYYTSKIIIELNVYEIYKLMQNQYSYLLK